MKKSAAVLGVVVVLGVAYVGSSWYVGKKTQDVVEQLVAQDNKELLKMMGPQGIAGAAPVVRIDDYKRGVFSSDVVFSINLPDDHGDKPVAIKFSDHLAHGPFPLERLKAGNFSPIMAVSHTQLVATPDTQSWFDALGDKGGSPITATTAIGFSGWGHSEWQIKPLNLIKEGTTVAFSGGTVNIDLANGFRDKTLDGRFGALDISDGNGRLEAKGIDLGGKTTWTAPDKTVSHATGTIDSFLVATHGNAPFAVSDWAMSHDSTQVGDMLDGALMYKLGKMTLGGVDIGSLQFGIKVGHVDMPALSALGEQYGKQQDQDDEDLTPDDMRQLEKVGHDKLKAVLASNPIVSVDPLEWKTPKGKSLLQVKLQLGNPEDVEDTKRVEVLLAQSVRDLKADATLSKPMVIDLVSQMMASQGSVPPQGFVESEVNHFADAIVQAGLAKEEGDNLVSHLHYQNGLVDINGRSMPVSSLIQQLLMLALAR